MPVVTTSVPPALYRRLADVAGREGATVDDLVRQAVEDVAGASADECRWTDGPPAGAIRVR